MAASYISVLAVLCTFCVATGMAQHGGGYGKDGFFQYVNVPGHKQYEFGYKRGNGYHNTARYEQAKDHRFRTRVVWKDAKGGYGEHYWEYNHGPKGYGKGSSGSGGGGGYGGHKVIHHDGASVGAVLSDDVAREASLQQSPPQSAFKPNYQ
ncbi:unnamed protein product [Cyprideis torosa]|uniref:Uncharacterized protein n=1 Tax=Cyprideis torosa TaxID=163714 RepID=A0A7R8ZNV6_9CRUS|nr:unnamed protein product [Cyprideis torosa]CAG0887248.1 unnamed protein product [Cyprideis torosa]